MDGPELCVIFNPAAGKHRGRERLEQIRQSWGTHAEFRPTERAGHAVELAEQAAREGFRVVAAAGGDGTAHEVLNGLMRANVPDVAFSILPIGSANDYAFSLDLEHQSAPLRRVDVGVVRAANGKSVYFGCNLGLGFNGQVTWESRQIHWLQGVFLYGLATLRAIAHSYQASTMTIHLDDEPAWTVPTLLFSALIGKREGGFVMAPKAEVDDGWLDFVHAANLSRWEIVRFLPRLALIGPPENHPKIRQGRCRRVTVRSESPLILHTDGELFCVPADGIREIAIELLPGALAVSRTPSFPASRHRRRRFCRRRCGRCGRPW